MHTWIVAQRFTDSVFRFNHRCPLIFSFRFHLQPQKCLRCLLVGFQFVTLTGTLVSCKFLRFAQCSLFHRFQFQLQIKVNLQIHFKPQIKIFPHLDSRLLQSQSCMILHLSKIRHSNRLSFFRFRFKLVSSTFALHFGWVCWRWSFSDWVRSLQFQLACWQKFASILLMIHYLLVKGQKSQYQEAMGSRLSLKPIFYGDLLHPVL